MEQCLRLTAELVIQCKIFGYYGGCRRGRLNLVRRRRLFNCWRVPITGVSRSTGHQGKGRHYSHQQYHRLHVYVSSFLGVRLRHQRLGKLQYLINLTRLEDTPYALRMEPGERRIDEVSAFHLSCLKDEGSQCLDEPQLQ